MLETWGQVIKFFGGGVHRAVKCSRMRWVCCFFNRLL